MWLACRMAQTSEQFEGLLDRYFETWLAENPTHAAYAGIESARGHLGRATLAFEKRWQGLRRKALAGLDSVSPGGLSNEQQLDPLAVRTQRLRGCGDFQRGRPTP